MGGPFKADQPLVSRAVHTFTASCYSIHVVYSFPFAFLSLSGFLRCGREEACAKSNWPEVATWGCDLYTETAFISIR